jgi:putative ribosome biogenesis GTPase RsgA
MLSAPTCGTYADITDQAGYKDAKAGVGACKVVDCTHNKNLECTAKSINIDERDGKILCMTYEAK